MSKRPRRIPKYRHYKPKNLGVVRINGKDEYLGKYDSPESWDKYHRLIAEWLSNGQQPAPPTTPLTEASPRLSVNEMLLAYWKFAKTYYSKEGKATKELSCMQEALQPLRELYGRTEAEDFGPKSLKAVRQHMLIERPSESGVSQERVPKRIVSGFVTKCSISPPPYSGLRLD
jgi:hypothetical protein